MTEQLQRVIEQIETLPEDERNAIAARLLELADERRWDTLPRHPKTDALLDMLSAEAEDEAGLTRAEREL